MFGLLAIGTYMLYALQLFALGPNITVWSFGHWHIYAVCLAAFCVGAKSVQQT